MNSRFKKRLLPLALFGAAFSSAFAATNPPDWKQTLSTYNVVWESPSNGSVDSMPLSGYNLALNVWAEKDAILLLVASPNCMDELGMQGKLGLLRIAFGAPVFEKAFRQELRLAESEIVVHGKTADGTPIQITLWCETNGTVAHLRIASPSVVQPVVSYETWSKFEPKIADGGIQWMRRLPDQNPRRQSDMNDQGMSAFAANIPDPLSKLTCGGRIDGQNLVEAPLAPGDFNGMVTKGVAMKPAAPVKQLDLTCTFRMEQDASASAWESALKAAAQKARKDREQSRAAALAWWAAFWNRSHIAIAPQQGVDPASDKPWQAARNYQLARYMLASNPAGRAMTLFNGGNFNCSKDPDKRFWDRCQFMAQNQRLVYWPMLRSGDFDMLSVALDFYRDRTEMSRQHAKKFWNVDGGVAWPEPFGIFGMDAIGTTPDGRSRPDHLHYHYTSGMEFALMMLEMGKYTGKMPRGYVAPALGILKYYDQFYQAEWKKKTGKPLDQKGRLVIYPSDACEPYHGCTNNTDVIAGLTALCRELLALPASDLAPDQRAYVEGFRSRIPDFPIWEKNGRKYYAAAESWEKVMFNGNMDFPQMYICFPFTILSLGRSDMSLAKNTWNLSPVKPNVQHQNQCWYQAAINFARMGLTADAARATLDKLLTKSERFPTFYHTYYAGGKKEFCHPPDTDHAGTSMIALQEMLMQADGKRILLGPAWPAEWGVSFKLRAPYQTTVEGRVQNGKIVVDKVTPESRLKDIETFPLKSAKLPAGGPGNVH